MGYKDTIRSYTGQDHAQNPQKSKPTWKIFAKTSQVSDTQV